VVAILAILIPRGGFAVAQGSPELDPVLSKEVCSLLVVLADFVSLHGSI
jgi:hypothetical protein